MPYLTQRTVVELLARPCSTHAAFALLTRLSSHAYPLPCAPFPPARELEEPRGGAGRGQRRAKQVNVRVLQFVLKFITSTLSVRAKFSSLNFPDYSRAYELFGAVCGEICEFLGCSGCGNYFARYYEMMVVYTLPLVRIPVEQRWFIRLRQGRKNLHSCKVHFCSVLSSMNANLEFLHTNLKVRSRLTISPL